ncbi:WhiB family transcriptional regulator [Streptomyces sp. CAU 1734]|uniref:WhiB family transcriptional regulator n=1 Tax=Streptomyces sp. CAU 1734 TaxID=3140360 RepID=UPI00326005F2
MNTPTTELPCSAAPETFHDDSAVSTARKLCARCPLAVQCRTQARVNREWGTWGGETSAERAAAGYLPAGWQGRGHKRHHKPCGTPAAYRRHLRAGQVPCPPCKNAEYRRRAEHADKRRKRAAPAAGSR